MGKALMILVAGFVVASAYYGSGRSDSMVASSNRVSDHQYELLAREAALKGYEITRQNLATHFVDGQVTGVYEGGTYLSTVAVSGTNASVTSTGTMPSSSGADVDYTVRAEYKQELILPADPPGFMDYALLANDDLLLNGNILTDVVVTGESAAELNANMHTNGDLDIRGNSVSVAGFGTYSGTGDASPFRALQNSFSPNYNPNGDLDNAHHAEPVELPVFDMASYLAKVTPTASDLGVVLSGDYTLGSRNSPYVWYIDGDLTTLGNTTMTGYGIVLVNGNIAITGNLNASDSGYGGADESSVAFYSTGDITLGGNVTIYGQMYANGNLWMHGRPSVYGSLTTAGTATLSGTPKIYYRKASPALTTIWQDPDSQSRLSAYSEF